MLRSHRWRTAENSAGYLLPHLAPGVSLLDVGCGPGTITVDLARRVAPGAVVGIDRSEEALAAASTLPFEDADVSFRVADLFSMPFEDASFDVVHAHQVLQHLGDPVAALVEMARVCRTGGLVAARDSDYSAMTWYPASPELTRWLDLYRAVARANGGEPDAGRRVLGWAMAAGFSDVTPSASTWCFATPEDRAWWADTWADRISVSTLAHRIVELGLAENAELAAIAAAWRQWAREPNGWFAIIHGEVVCRCR